MTRAYWKGVRLVFERGLTEQLRSKTFRVVTGILLVVSVAAVVLPRLVTSGVTTYTLATVGDPPTAVVATLDAAGEAGEFEVEYVTRGSPADVRTAVRDGDATVGLTGGAIYAAAEDAGTFPAVVAQAIVSLQTVQRLEEAGLTPQEVAELQSIRPPRQVTVTPVENEGRAWVGAAVGFVLYFALLFGGNVIATSVATEKSTRISEVLLAVLRPSQILVGTVVAVGTATLLQLLVLGAPVAVAMQVTDDGPLPAVASGDILLGVAWFLLGFALYAFLYAATGALVDKVTEVGTATGPLAMILVVGYLTALFVVTDGPSSPWSVAASMFPLTAPLTMPLRWATGEVPVYQLLLAMALTAGTALGLAALASGVYRRALVITGRRVRVRELFAPRSPSPG